MESLNNTLNKVGRFGTPLECTSMKWEAYALSLKLPMPFYKHVGFIKWLGISPLGCFKGDVLGDIVIYNQLVFSYLLSNGLKCVFFQASVCQKQCWVEDCNVPYGTYMNETRLYWIEMNRCKQFMFTSFMQVLQRCFSVAVHDSWSVKANL